MSQLGLVQDRLNNSVINMMLGVMKANMTDINPIQEAQTSSTLKSNTRVQTAEELSPPSKCHVQIFAEDLLVLRSV
jgi:hypothetical protein